MQTHSHPACDYKFKTIKLSKVITQLQISTECYTIFTSARSTMRKETNNTIAYKSIERNLT